MSCLVVAWRVPYRPDLYGKESYLDYMLCEVREIEIVKARKDRPGLIGIPYMWCRCLDGDVDWFPDSEVGQPVVHIID